MVSLNVATFTSCGIAAQCQRTKNRSFGVKTLRSNTSQGVSSRGGRVRCTIIGPCGKRRCCPGKKARALQETPTSYTVDDGFGKHIHPAGLSFGHESYTVDDGGLENIFIRPAFHSDTSGPGDLGI